MRQAETKITLGDALSHSPLFRPCDIMKLIRERYIACTWVAEGPRPRRHTYMTWEINLRDELVIDRYSFQPGTLTLITNKGTLVFFGEKKPS